MFKLMILVMKLNCFFEILCLQNQIKIFIPQFFAQLINMHFLIDNYVHLVSMFVLLQLVIVVLLERVACIFAIAMAMMFVTTSMVPVLGTVQQVGDQQTVHKVSTNIVPLKHK